VNTIAVKFVLLCGFLMPADIIVFPLIYLFDDILTEVCACTAMKYFID